MDDIQMKEDAVVCKVVYKLPKSFAKILMDSKYKWKGHFPLLLPHNESLYELLVSERTNLILY